MAIETAKEFATRVHADPETEWHITPTIALIEARDAAVARAAKLELLEEIAALDDGHLASMYRAVETMRSKYGAAKDGGR